MNKSLAALACVAWSAVGIASSSPVNAQILTTQSGDYASCAANYNYDPISCVFDYTYDQNIKFVTNPCNGGGCNDTGSVHVDNVLSTGRKRVTNPDTCGGYNLYLLFNCAC